MEGGDTASVVAAALWSFAGVRQRRVAACTCCVGSAGGAMTAAAALAMAARAAPRRGAPYSTLGGRPRPPYTSRSSMAAWPAPPARSSSPAPPVRCSCKCWRAHKHIRGSSSPRRRASSAWHVQKRRSWRRGAPPLPWPPQTDPFPSVPSAPRGPRAPAARVPLPAGLPAAWLAGPRQHCTRKGPRMHFSRRGAADAKKEEAARGHPQQPSTAARVLT